MGFSEATHARAREIIARYPEGRERSALLPLLHLVQSEEGHVTPAGVQFCADQLGLTKAQVGAVATFYTMYKRKPTGDWLVSVCTNTMCNVLGGQAVYDALSERLGVGHDETTADGTITLEHAECLAACDYGPVMTVNYDFFDNVDPDIALDIVERLRAGERPQPTRGARLCTLKEMSLQLAGFADEREGAVGDGPAGASTLRGARLAERHGISVAGFDPDTPIGKQEAKPEPRPAAPSAPARDTKTPDQKAPDVRAAETRNVDAASTGPGTGTVTPAAPAQNAAEAAGSAASEPARDASPSGQPTEPQQRNLKEAK